MELIQLNKVSEIWDIIETEGPVAPNPANLGNNENANYANADHNNENNAPAGPNAPPLQQPAPNQPAPNQSTPNQPAPNQPAPNQPAPANPAGPTPPAHLNPQQPALANLAGPFAPVPNLLQPFPYQPAPQIIHQQMINWSYFKPEFAGRPEQDAVVHLLHTNDWMRTYNFDKDVKVQRFCWTLVGEAWLWHESLTPVANDWPVLQESFRRQYSKLENTPEQLFHQWRTLSFDENTDTVNSYVTKISQSVAMLNFVELQILELFKNTLPSRLYWVLFPTDNLRDAITRAKRVLTKEKIDQLMTGQASSTSFMRVSDGNQSSSRTSKRGVTFNAMDAIERNSDSIDKLTSLVSKMNMKMDKREAPYKPNIYQGRPRGQR